MNVRTKRGMVTNNAYATNKVSVFGVIQSECGKIRTRITPNADIFYVVQWFHSGHLSKIFIVHSLFVYFGS